MAEQTRVKLKNCSIPGVGLPGQEVTIDDGHARHLVEAGVAEYVEEAGESVEQEPGQCQGKTKSGRQCGKKARPGSLFCSTHQDQEVEEEEAQEEEGE